MSDITKREQDLLLFIIKFKQVNGFTPTVREMSKGICMGSRSTIISMLNHLEENQLVILERKRIYIPRFEELVRYSQDHPDWE